MKISEKQVDEFITLYKQEYNVELERTEALSQLNKLISLVLYMAFPEGTVRALEEKSEEEYNIEATHKA